MELLHILQACLALNTASVTCVLLKIFTIVKVTPESLVFLLTGFVVEFTLADMVCLVRLI